MNPLTNVKNIAKLNEQELKLGISGSCSWHKIYKDSPWIFIGGLDYDLTEGDVICVFSQYGEVEDINLVRDKKTGKSKGFCFLKYQNKNSTILAVDNFNGIKLCGRTIRVDHVADYRPPKESKNEKEESGEDSTTIVKPVQKHTIEETKTRHKDKQYKAVTNDNEELSKMKHYHKSKHVPKEESSDKEKTHTHHHRTRDLSSERLHQKTTSRHFDKDNLHSHKAWKTERKYHFSSDESIKDRHKLKKQKYNDGKSKLSRKQNHSHSSSEESDERAKHKSKYKHKKHKHKVSRHNDSDS